jgi:hypothetical protein
MNTIAEQYVKLVLAVGQHDADYVDAYSGPKEWLEAAQKNKMPLDAILSSAWQLSKQLRSIAPPPSGEMEQLRHQYLVTQLSSLIARVEMLKGKKFLFDQESKALYDAVAPTNNDDHYRQILARLDHLLPVNGGAGNIQQRYERFRSAFVIPPGKLDSVFQAAVEECRKRTQKHIPLPPGESFTVEYVTNKSWSGYNWYKGNSFSLIQMNTDLPIYIDRAVDLGAHEGYPGHHVYNVLLEKNLLKGRGWIEFSVYALFSPQSLIAEGTANYGREVVFTREERSAFERDVLFPLAGLDPSQVEHYYAVHELMERLAYADNDVARRYLNGEIDREAAARWLVEFKLLAPERAAQRVRFIDQYRSYVINYNLGQDLVKRYIESRGGTPSHPDKRWKEFAELISSPRLPSDLT